MPLIRREKEWLGDPSRAARLTQRDFAALRAVRIGRNRIPLRDLAPSEIRYYFRGWTPADHEVAIARAVDLANAAAHRYNRALAVAYRIYGERGPLISGVGQDHFPAEVKEGLRASLRAHGDAQMAAEVHWLAAHGRRRRFADSGWPEKMVKAGYYGYGRREAIAPPRRGSKALDLDALLRKAQRQSKKARSKKPPGEVRPWTLVRHIAPGSSVTESLYSLAPADAVAMAYLIDRYGTGASADVAGLIVDVEAGREPLQLARERLEEARALVKPARMRPEVAKIVLRDGRAWFGFPRGGSRSSGFG
jgi:hypothetical protein